MQLMKKFDKEDKKLTVGRILNVILPFEGYVRVNLLLNVPC